MSLVGLSAMRNRTLTHGAARHIMDQAPRGPWGVPSYCTMDGFAYTGHRAVPKMLAPKWSQKQRYEEINHISKLLHTEHSCLRWPTPPVYDGKAARNRCFIISDMRVSQMSNFGLRPPAAPAKMAILEVTP